MNKDGKKTEKQPQIKNRNLPNQLTMLRMFLVPVFVVILLWCPKPAANYIAAVIFIVASLTDTADGYIARKYNLVSVFGKFMDRLRNSA